MGHCTSNTAKKQHRTQTPNNHDPNMMNDVSLKCINNSIEINTSPSFFFITIRLNNELILSKKEIPIETTFGFLFDSIHLNSNYDYIYKYTSSQNDTSFEPSQYQEFTFYHSEQLKSKFPLSHSYISLSISYIGLDVVTDILSYSKDNISYIGSPMLSSISSSLSLLLFNPKTSTFTISQLSLPEEIIHYTTSLSSFSSYCNCNGVLYISGGIIDADNRNYSSLIFSIYLSSMKVGAISSMKNPHAWHSMLYLPSHEILIVSGLDSKIAEVFDTESNCIIKETTMNEMRCESSCIIVNNDYVYAFCGYLENFGFLNSIEKCNIRRNSLHWEVVNYKIDDDTVFYPSFSPLMVLEDNIIILYGVNEINSNGNKEWVKSYKMKIENGEKISLWESNLMTGVIFEEKNVKMISRERSILISKEIAGTKKVVYVDNMTGEIEEVKEINI